MITACIGHSIWPVWPSMRKASIFFLFRAEIALRGRPSRSKTFAMAVPSVLRAVMTHVNVVHAAVITFILLSK